MDSEDRKHHLAEMRYALAALLVVCSTAVVMAAVLAGQKTDVSFKFTASISLVFTLAGVGGIMKMSRQRAEIQRLRTARTNIENVNRRLESEIADARAAVHSLEVTNARLEERLTLADENSRPSLPPGEED